MLVGWEGGGGRRTAWFSGGWFEGGCFLEVGGGGVGGWRGGEETVREGCEGPGEC